MSRIGKMPVTVPGSVSINLEKNYLVVKGPKGELSRELHPSVTIEFNDGKLTVNRINDSKESRSIHGLSRALIANMVEGVTNGYTKKLQIIGVGYKAEMKGKVLHMALGYSHPIVVAVPDDISIVTPTPTTIEISGINKEIVGKIAAKIRSFREPEPYKGKGIKYENEYIRRKAGKTAGK